MKQDQTQHPANTDLSAGASEAERQEKIAQLYKCGSKLSAENAALLRVVYGDIMDAHHELVAERIRRRCFSRQAAEELYQDVFLALHHDILENGLREDVPRVLRWITRGKLLNYGHAQERISSIEGLPSSRSEVPPTAPDLDRAMDLRELSQRLLPEFPPDRQKIAQKGFFNDLSHSEAAEELGLTLGQLKARVVAARRVLLALAQPLVPPNQRGPA